MAFVKVYKNNAYFKRFQTKFRRRREGKTDYYARKRMILQDKDKYNTPKYRLVARISNKQVTAQIVFSTLKGDRVLSSANSFELKRWGLTTALSNYASAYATGLLLARRVLKQLGMDKFYAGVDKVTGEVYDVAKNPNAERRPFTAILDAGLARTTVGNRVFAVLKGACDGGLHIPHKEKRFPGYSKGEDAAAGGTYNPEVHRQRIYGVHVDNYMKELKQNNQEAYKKQFSKLDKCLKDKKVDSLEKLYAQIHQEIRKNPDRLKAAKKDKPNRDHQKKYHKRKLTLDERKRNIQKKIEIYSKGQQGK